MKNINIPPSVCPELGADDEWCMPILWFTSGALNVMIESRKHTNPHGFECSYGSTQRHPCKRQWLAAPTAFAPRSSAFPFGSGTREDQ